MDCEIVVIGCVLAMPENYAECVHEGLTPEAFKQGPNRNIWNAIVEIEREKGDTSISEQSVAEWMTTHLDQTGKAHGITAADLLSITGQLETTSTFKSSLLILIDGARRRKIAEKARALAYAVEHDRENEKQAAAELEQELALATTSRSDKQINQLVEYADNVFSGRVKMEDGLRSGICKLDDKFTVKRGRVLTLAARPGMGKSSLVFNYADDALKRKCGVVIANLEMSGEETIIRWSCRRAKVNKKKFADNLAGIEDKMAIERELKWFRQHSEQLIVDDNTDRNIYEISTWVKNLKKRNPSIGLFILDYLQLVPAANKRLPREQQVAEISRNLKLMAKNLNIAVIALSQLKRGDQENPIPALEDLRESGSIEQDSDAVMFICPTEKDEGGKHKAGGKMWLNLAKNRDGDVGLFPSNFVRWCTLFENHDDTQPQYQPQTKPKKKVDRTDNWM